MTSNDSEATSHFAGVNLDLSGNSSISIGYLGELYIDFGYVGAVVGAFLIGLLGGRAYAVLRAYRGIPLFFSYAIATMVLLQFILFETDLVGSLALR